MADRLQRRVLVVLCGTQITSWGTLYYAFPVLAPSLSADTGWSVPSATAAFSAGLVVSALVGIPVGRLLDRIGPRQVMTAGSVLAVPAVVGIATARSFPLFVAAWLLAGVAMAGTLYPPAFAALTRWWGPRRVVALTGLTLAAGLTSTIFGPLTAALLGPLGWRNTYLALAVALAVVTIPGHFWGLRGTWPDPEPPQHPAHADPGRVARSGPFLLLTAALTGGAFAVYAVLVGQVPLLIERGMSTTAAAWTLGLGGVGQVLGRLGYGGLARLLGVRTRTVVVLAACSATTVLLGLLPGPAAALVAAVMLAGAARGIFTLLQATAVTDRWGSVYYGRLSGLVSAPSTFATALAPWAGAAMAAPLGGYPGVFLLLAGVAVVAAALAAWSVPRLTTGAVVVSGAHAPGDERGGDPGRPRRPPWPR